MRKLPENVSEFLKMAEEDSVTSAIINRACNGETITGEEAKKLFRYCWNKDYQHHKEFREGVYLAVFSLAKIIALFAVTLVCFYKLAEVSPVYFIVGFLSFYFYIKEIKSCPLKYTKK